MKTSGYEVILFENGNVIFIIYICLGCIDGKEDDDVRIFMFTTYRDKSKSLYICAFTSSLYRAGTIAVVQTEEIY